ncbi:g7322 [Coccomyxa elongata]
MPQRTEAFIQSWLIKLEEVSKTVDEKAAALKRSGQENVELQGCLNGNRRGQGNMFRHLQDLRIKEAQLAIRLMRTKQHMKQNEDSQQVKQGDELLLLQAALKSLCSKEVHQMQTFAALMDHHSTCVPILHAPQLDGGMHKQNQFFRKLHAAKQTLYKIQKDNESAEESCSALQTELSHLAQLSRRLSERKIELQGRIRHEEAAAESVKSAEAGDKQSLARLVDTRSSCIQRQHPSATTRTGLLAVKGTAFTRKTAHFLGKKGWAHSPVTLMGES